MPYKRITNRFDLIGSLIEGKKVLDIGCADARPGEIRKFESSGLHRFLLSKAASVKGVELDAGGAEEMREKGYDVVCANAENMALDEKFDCIVAGEIIEHVNNAGMFIESMEKHLTDDGILVLTTPNAFGIPHFSRILWKKRVKVHPDHTCWYDPITITQLIHRFNLEVKDIYFTNKEKWYRPRYYYKIFRYQLPKFISWLRPYFSSTIIVVVQKAKGAG